MPNLIKKIQSKQNYANDIILDEHMVKYVSILGVPCPCKRLSIFKNNNGINFAAISKSISLD